MKYTWYEYTINVIKLLEGMLHGKKVKHFTEEERELFESHIKSMKDLMEG